MSDGLTDLEWGDGGFAKLYGDRLADSSLLDCSVATRWVFLYMVARADAEGLFRCASIKGLARATAVTLKEASTAVTELEAPDPDSTSSEEEGRRIVRIAGGWRIVTYRKYRDYQTKRQRDDAERKRRQRERERDMSRDVLGYPLETPNTKRQTPEREDIASVGREVVRLPTHLPPEQRAEHATRDTIRSLQVRLGKLLAQLEAHPRNRDPARTVVEWCRTCTAYDRQDGTRAKGVADYRTIESVDRLERSIADAEWWLAKLGGDHA